MNNSTSKQLLWGGSFAAISLAGLLFFQHFTKDLAHLEKPEPHQASLIMTNAIYIHYNQNGIRETRMTTPYLRQYPYKNSASYTDPRMIWYVVGKTPWYINADHGTSLDGGQTIDLTGNVWIHRNGSNTTQATTITTQALTIFPQIKQAHTSLAVTFIQPSWTIHAIGATAYMNKGEIRLLSHIHGVYQNGH